jgi:mRNA-degrading endonuclease RelE of RelBE toxin-antitoxin system
MDNKRYEVRHDFAEGLEVLGSLAEKDREKVEEAIASLAKDPWPKRFEAKPLGGETVKITVPVEDDEITILYDVNVYESSVDIIRIKRRTAFKKAGDWLAGLMKFEPKVK